MGADPKLPPPSPEASGCGVLNLPRNSIHGRRLRPQAQPEPGESGPAPRPRDSFPGPRTSSPRPTPRSARSDFARQQLRAAGKEQELQNAGWLPQGTKGKLLITKYRTPVPAGLAAAAPYVSPFAFQPQGSPYSMEDNNPHKCKTVNKNEQN
ncbi:unnamed protein product [Lepidochelys kempii]